MEMTEDLEVDFRIGGSSFDDGLFRHFWAMFWAPAHDGHDGEEVGTVSGWVIWGALNEDVFLFGDGMSGDSSLVSWVGERLLEEQGWEDGFVENLLLIDRIFVHLPHRGKGRLRDMVDLWVHTLRMDVLGCFLVAELEPQKKGGGPYEEGPMKERAMTGP